MIIRKNKFEASEEEKEILQNNASYGAFTFRDALCLSIISGMIRKAHSMRQSRFQIRSPLYRALISQCRHSVVSAHNNMNQFFTHCVTFWSAKTKNDICAAHWACAVAIGMSNEMEKRRLELCRMSNYQEGVIKENTTLTEKENHEKNNCPVAAHI
ncbi:hypothetical protein Tcan_01158, partial [Toxocara canis]